MTSLAFLLSLFGSSCIRYNALGKSFTWLLCVVWSEYLSNCLPWQTFSNETRSLLQVDGWFLFRLLYCSGVNYNSCPLDQYPYNRSFYWQQRNKSTPLDSWTVLMKMCPVFQCQSGVFFSGNDQMTDPASTQRCSNSPAPHCISNVAALLTDVSHPCSRSSLWSHVEP